jgi:hypothetical protein
MTIAESKDPFAVKDTVLMVPVFAISVAISWEVGKFSVTGGFFFFSLSEHLISAISALPVALGVALLTVGVLATIKKRPDEPTAPWTKKQKARMVLLATLFGIACGVGAAWTNSLSLLILGTMAALMAIIFGILALERSDTLSVLSFVVMGALLPLAAASDFTVSLDSPRETQSTIKLKSGSHYGVIIMAGERGILVFKRDTRTYLFLRADEVLNIEYMMPRDELPWPF